MPRKNVGLKRKNLKTSVYKNTAPMSREYRAGGRLHRTSKVPQYQEGGDTSENPSMAERARRFFMPTEDEQIAANERRAIADIHRRERRQKHQEREKRRQWATQAGREMDDLGRRLRQKRASFNKASERRSKAIQTKIKVRDSEARIDREREAARKRGLKDRFFD